MEDIIKITKTIEITEYKVKCGKCDYLVIGSTKTQIIYNLNEHKDSKRCKRLSKKKIEENK